MGVEQTKGHINADGCGLRGHSVGAAYPFIIVGVEGEFPWAVQCPDGRLIRGYHTARTALVAAMDMKEHGAPPLPKPFSVKAGAAVNVQAALYDPRCFEV